MSNHYQSNHWASNHWQSNHFAGAAVVEPPAQTPTRHGAWNSNWRKLLEKAREKKQQEQKPRRRVITNRGVVVLRRFEAKSECAVDHIVSVSGSAQLRRSAMLSLASKISTTAGAAVLAARLECSSKSSVVVDKDSAVREPDELAVMAGFGDFDEGGL